MKYLLKFSFFICALLFLSLPSYAQQSMKESQKLRIQEEKRRTKLNKKAEKSEKKQSKTDKTAKKMTRKDRAQVPKAAQRLSYEGEKVNQVRSRSRKGNQGLTNAAKIQKKSERKRRKSLKR